MGYRSFGKIYIDKEAQKTLTEEHWDDLNNSWTKSEEEDFWEFDGWKWYDGYKEVDMWNNFYYTSQDTDNIVDFLVIGEDSAIIIEPQFEKLGYSMSIETY